VWSVKNTDQFNSKCLTLKAPGITMVLQGLPRSGMNLCLEDVQTVSLCFLGSGVVAEMEMDVLGKFSDHLGTAIKEELKVAVAI